MKIKTKLLMGLSTKPLIIIVLIVNGWLQISNLDKLSIQTQNKYELTLLAEGIQREVKNEAISLRNIVLFTDKDSIQKELTNLQSESNAVTHDIALFEAKVKTEGQHDSFESLENANIKFNVYKDEIIELVNNGQKEKAIKLINSDSHSIHDEFFEVISGITDNLESDMISSFANITEDTQKQIGISSLISLILVIISASFIASIVWKFATRLSKVSKLMTSVANGEADLGTKVEVNSNDEIDDVASSFNKMVESLDEQLNREQEMLWIKSNMADITTGLSSSHNLEILSSTFLSMVVPLLESSHAVFYVKNIDEEIKRPVYRLIASYAFEKGGNFPNSFELGEGLVGQAALGKSPIILEDIPSEYMRIKSGLGEAPPLTIYVLPIIFEDDVKAVIEIASFKPFSIKQHALLEEAVNSLGIVLESVIGRIRLAKLLEESQTLMEEIQVQSEELQSQQEELRVTNEELEEQTQALIQSERILQTQQEELEQTNLELKEKAQTLEEQNKIFELTNKEVEKARAELHEKAEQLAINSKYKSEFLANMSHELRTPLNSLLILSKLLADNQEGNLSEKQRKFAKTIHSSGNDLLELINDILDLAKIESGKMEVNPSRILISDLTQFVENGFRPIANEKNLSFNIVLGDRLPEYIHSDEQRLRQILINLLSNAFKFTHKGGVTLEIGLDPQASIHSTFIFSIADTGIGIPKEKQELIFQAFQQADGTTSRRYGGTGLGLSICRESANLLNAEIAVESEYGKGSRFSLILSDYSDKESMGDSIISFGEVAVSEEIQGCNPTSSAIQISMPVESKLPQFGTGNKEIKRLLIVDNDQNHRKDVMELIGGKNVIIKAVSTELEAMEELKVNRFDFMILNLGLTNSNAFELIEKIKIPIENGSLILFIYADQNLSTKEEIYLRKYAHTIIIKDARSLQRLEDEFDLYLNSSDESFEIRNLTENSQAKDYTGLEGKKILLVDDDVRNVYSLMSLLELYQMDITFAENGKESIEILESSAAFDLILMDIMMPEMDGYEAIRKIRISPRFSTIPIIALTAKAMKEDRQKCMDAGASDYIVKPFDTDQLISLIRVWLY